MDLELLCEEGVVPRRSIFMSPSKSKGIGWDSEDVATEIVFATSVTYENNLDMRDKTRKRTHQIHLQVARGIQSEPNN
jgi:hypothetical protein